MAVKGELVALVLLPRLAGALQLRSTACRSGEAAPHESVPGRQQPHACSQLAAPSLAAPQPQIEALGVGLRRTDHGVHGRSKLQPAMGERSFADDVKQPGYGAGEILRDEGILAMTKAGLQPGGTPVAAYPGAPVPSP